MSSHIHMIIGRNGDAGLDGIIRDIKKFTSVKIIEAIIFTVEFLLAEVTNVSIVRNARDLICLKGWSAIKASSQFYLHNTSNHPSSLLLCPGKNVQRPDTNRELSICQSYR